jgi:1-acyl-sn-glycerol-3-phosphate acyltransferase
MSEVDSFMVGSSLPAKAFYMFGRNVVVGITRILCRPTIIGREKIPATGAFVLAPVHRSYIDTPLAAVVTRRRLRFMGKDSMWKWRPFGWVLSALGSFPVTRGTADREALKRCVAVLDSGDPLVLFPEGERKDGPIVQPLFDGAAFVAVKAGVPIVPLGIGGSDKAWVRGHKLPRFAKCTLIVGDPIFTESIEGARIARSNVRDVTTQLQIELQRLYDAASK